VGTFEGEDVLANFGRFGPYLLHKEKFTSLPKGEDPVTIEIERAGEVIVAKRESDLARILRTFEGSEWIIKKGKWNKPYLVAEGANIALPKEFDVEQATLEDCLELFEKYKESPAGKKATSKGKKTTKAGTKTATKTASKTASKTTTKAATKTTTKAATKTTASKPAAKATTAKAASASKISDDTSKDSPTIITRPKKKLE